jgi:hypothetical protein
MRWTQEKIELLKTYFPTMHRDDLCEMLGCTPSALGTKASELGIKKEKKWKLFMLHQSGTISGWQKGRTSWNKGMKMGENWGGKETRFKPGQEPHNKLPQDVREAALQLRKLKKNIKGRLCRRTKSQI